MVAKTRGKDGFKVIGYFRMPRWYLFLADLVLVLLDEMFDDGKGYGHPRRGKLEAAGLRS